MYITRMGMFFLAYWLVPLTIVIVFMAMAIRAIVLTITPPRRSVAVPSCERCKYPVAGLSVFNCPECGSDWRVVGIATRAMEMRRRGGIWGAIIGLTYLFLVTLGFAMIVVSANIGSAFAASAAPTIITTTFRPASGAYRTLILDQVRTYGSTVSGFDAALEIDLSDGSTRRMEITSSRRYQTFDSGKQQLASGAFNRAAVIQWFASAELDASDTAILSEIDEAVRVVEGILIAPYTSAATTTGSGLTIASVTTNAPPNASPATTTNAIWTILGWLIPLVLSVLWLASIIFIVRRRRRLLREAEAPIADGPIPHVQMVDAASSPPPHLPTPIGPAPSRPG